MRGHGSNHAILIISQLFGKAVLGEAGLIIFCLLSVVMIFGTANANLFADSRYAYTPLLPESMSSPDIGSSSWLQERV